MKHLYDKSKPGIGRLAYAAVTAIGLVLAVLIHPLPAAASDFPVYEVGGDEVRYVDFPVYFISDETQVVSVSDIAAGVLPGGVISSRYVIPRLNADRWFIFDVLRIGSKIT